MRSKKPAPRKVPVTERAVLQRINRKLAKDGEMIRQQRNWPAVRDLQLGRFYRIDIAMNAVTGHDLDLEELARELDVMKAWEELQK